MAYLREEKENLEVDHPLIAIWEAIPKAIDKLEWKIEETDESTHHLKVKTKGAFASYPSIMLIDLAAVEDEKVTRMLISAQTPVTTLTSMADFGRTRDRIEQFVVTLAKLMSR
jgi:hypothetical protein